MVMASPQQLATSFTKLVQDYMEYAQQVFIKPVHAALAGPASWSPPPTGRVKINTDAHLMNGGGVSLGVVLRDAQGQIIATGVKRIQARWEVEQAEVAGVKFGMQVARRMGHVEMMVESDALTVVRSINNNITGFSPLLLYYEDIARMKRECVFFNCSHVRRAGNTVAHLITRWNTDASEFVCSDNSPKVCLLWRNLIYVNKMPPNVSFKKKN